MAVTLTPAAAARIRTYLAETPGGIGLRFGVRKSGCSGFAYVVDIATSPGADDQVFATDGVEADTSRPLVLAFGGEAPENFDFSTDLETRYNTVNQFFVVDPRRKAALLERMKERNSLLLSVPLTGGTEASKDVWLSLRGVMASIDFMATYARRVAQY